MTQLARVPPMATRTPETRYFLRSRMRRIPVSETSVISTAEMSMSRDHFGPESRPLWRSLMTAMKPSRPSGRPRRPEVGPDFFPAELAVAVLVERLEGGRGVGDFGCGDNGIVVGVPAPSAKVAVYSSLLSGERSSRSGLRTRSPMLRRLFARSSVA